MASRIGREMGGRTANRAAGTHGKAAVTDSKRRQPPRKHRAYQFQEHCGARPVKDGDKGRVDGSAGERQCRQVLPA